MTSIKTYSGRIIDLLNPDQSLIDINDIAHHLSRINRYAGATEVGYSVAQHSVIISQLRPTLEALLHDAHEAYIGDMSLPAKIAMRQIMVVSPWDILEKEWVSHIAYHFGLNTSDKSWKCYDDGIRLDEMRCMVRGCEGYPVTFVEHIEPVGEDEAEEMFLRRFHELNETR